MQNRFFKKINGVTWVIACQLVVMLFVLLIYLFNKGDAFQKEFCMDEYWLADYVSLQETATVEQGTAPEGVFLRTPPMSLDKGVYRIQVDYNASHPGSTLQAYSTELGYIDWCSTPAKLEPSLHSTCVTLELKRAAEDVVIEGAFSGTGALEVSRIGVYETSNLYKRNIFYGLLTCALIALGYYFMRSNSSKRKVMLALSGIYLISCYPLFANYLMVGHDLPFHLLRIEGLAAGLSQGSFPVKIHPVWAWDYGYAVGIFYGDAALYFPAILRLLGFSIQTAYQYFVAAIQLATVIVSYFTFKRMFRSSNIGLLGSLLYSLSLYRLADVYTRASVGEFTAMLFFPLVFCGFYLIFTDGNRNNWWRYGILTALGLTGLIQSHILSCEMSVLFIGLTCIFLIRSVIKPYKFLALVSGAVLTLLLNLGFLVPFLSYFNEDIMIHSSDWVGSTNGAIQDTGMFPLQLFSLFQKSNGGTWSTHAGVYNEATYGLGIIFLMGLGLFLYLLLCHRKECAKDCNFRPACFSFGLGLLALWMSSCYFPWDAIASSNAILDKLIVSVEFPWRMLAPATVLLTFVICFALSKLSIAFKEQHAAILLGSCLVLLFINIGWYYYDFVFTTQPYRVHDTYELDTMTMYSYDYLPAGTDPDQIKAGEVLAEGVARIDGYTKTGTKILCHVTAEDNGGWIDFPLNYYEDYVCHTSETSEELSVSAGTNNMVRVTLPEGFSGPLQLSFKEPLLWRISEAVSLLTLLGCIGTIVFVPLKKNHFDPKKN